MLYFCWHYKCISSNMTHLMSPLSFKLFSFFPVFLIYLYCMIWHIWLQQWTLMGMDSRSWGTVYVWQFCNELWMSMSSSHHSILSLALRNITQLNTCHTLFLLGYSWVLFKSNDFIFSWTAWDISTNTMKSGLTTANLPSICPSDRKCRVQSV